MNPLKEALRRKIEGNQSKKKFGSMFDQQLFKYVDEHLHAFKVSEIKNGNFHRVALKVEKQRNKTAATSEKDYKNFTQERDYTSKYEQRRNKSVLNEGQRQMQEYDGMKESFDNVKEETKAMADKLAEEMKYYLSKLDLERKDTLSRKDTERKRN